MVWKSTPPATPPPPAPSNATQQLAFQMLTRDELPPVISTGDKWRALDHIINGEAISAQGDSVSEACVDPFWKAFSVEVQNDLFATMYAISSVEGSCTHAELRRQQMYRLTTSSPQSLVDAGWIKNTNQVMMHSLIIELDLKDIYAKEHNLDPRGNLSKIPWDDEQIELVVEKYLKQAIEKLPILGKPTVFFSTLHGFRLVFLLDHPIPMLGLNGGLDRLQGLLIDCIAAGLPVDTACRDWTRLQRLPRVIREKQGTSGPVSVKTGDDPYFHQSWGCIDFDAQDTDAPEAFVAHNPESFPPLRSRDVANDFRGHPNEIEIIRVATGVGGGSVEGTTRADVNCGQSPDASEVKRILHGREDAKPNFKSPMLIDLHKILKDITKAKTNIQKPRVAAAYRLMDVIWGEKRIDIDERGVSNLHSSGYNLANEICWIYINKIGVNAGDLTPQLIYAMIIGPMITANESRLENDSGRRTEEVLTDEVWRMVTDVFKKRLGKHNAEATQKEEEEEELEEMNRITEISGTGENYQLIFEQFLLWGFKGDWIEENLLSSLIISSDEGMSVICIKNGQVVLSPPKKTLPDLAIYLRQSGHDLIKYRELPKRLGDEEQIKRLDKILHDHGTHAVGIKLSRIVKGNCLEPIIESGEIRPRLILKVPGVSENVPAEYSETADKFFRAMGGELAEVFLDYLSFFPNIEHALAVLYICAGTGTGKGVIIAAFKLITMLNQDANFVDTLGNFQDGLKASFLLTVDEGVITGNEQYQKNISEVVRRIVGGNMGILNFKGIPGSHIEGEWRILVTANHPNVFDFGSDMTENDMDAIVSRFLYIMPNEKECRRLLAEAGGRYGDEKGIGTEAAKWPFMLAKQIMWYSKNRKVKKGKRFLIDCPKTEWHEERRIQSSGGLLVCRAVADLLLDHGLNDSDETIQIVKPEDVRDKYKDTVGIWIHSQRLHQKLKDLFAHDPSVKVPPATVFRKYLLTLSKQGRFLKKQGTGGSKKQERGYQLDITAIIEHLYRAGFECDFRKVFGDVLWKQVAPPEIYAEFEELDKTIIDDPEPTTPVSKPIYTSNYKASSNQKHDGIPFGRHTSGHNNPT